MADIAERLRSFGPDWTVKHTGAMVPYEVCVDAADEIERLRRENLRLVNGLNIIVQAGLLHGAGWCVAQAIGHRDDLDYDHYPETGRPEKSATAHEEQS